MIELKHFISQTLTEIVEGVVEAQSTVEKHGARASPSMLTIHGDTPRTESEAFDVDVTTADSTTSKKRMGVFVALRGPPRVLTADARA